uniref:Regulatory protein E2 n=1 Tax=Human papillomavirus TaxID=10566 RepID=A0A385PJ17_9PAPI|nr:MAG: E2 protein [Human papillomavirus]
MTRVETQETLSERFAVLQEAILSIYEEGAKDLNSQIKYWDLIRKENVLLYYAKKEGFTRLGLQPTPTPAVSEYKAKQAIQIQLLLKSLSKSPYATEEWTLPDTSAELLNTEPRNCFKKLGYTVEVWFDHDRKKAFPYTNWKYIYYQDQNEKWHKVQGHVDDNGLYYNEVDGDTVYFILFGSDADKYGDTGEWTVKYENTSIVSTSSSSGRTKATTVSTIDKQPTTSGYTATQSESPGRHQREITVSSSTTEGADLRSRRRGSGERASPVPKRRRTTEPTEPQRFSPPTPGEVGTRHRSAPRSGLSRLRRLEIEAWDPPIIIVTGSANTLKCWRNRNKTNSLLYKCSSTVWKWIGEGPCGQNSRMLIAFESVNQRNLFLRTVKLPKNTSYGLGSLDIL